MLFPRGQGMIECKIHASFSLVLKNEILTVVRYTFDLEIGFQKK
jgi:hypothetical protein